MTKGIVITTDGEVQPFDGEYAELNEAVGGYIEAVPVITKHVTMYCAEEGKLMGFPPNAHATHVWMFLGGVFNVLTGDHIVGNVVLVGGVDANGDNRDLAPWVADRIRWIMFGEEAS